MVIILMGFSGSGKTYIGEYLKTLGFRKAVTQTTRSPRIGEVNHIDYHFKESKEDFFSTELVEYAEYPKGSGKFYGLPVSEISNIDEDVYCILELSGAINVKKIIPEAKIIFVNVEESALETRMIERGDSEESIKERLSNIYNSDEYKSSEYADFILDNSGTIEKTQEILKNYLKEL